MRASACEQSVRFGMVLVAVVLPGGNFLDHGLPVGDTPIETLARQDAEFGLCHFQPAVMLGRVAPLEPLDEPPLPRPFAMPASKAK